jgi:hypothetical protein
MMLAAFLLATALGQTINPHGAPEHCQACHTEPVEGAAGLDAAGLDAAVCTSCHTGLDRHMHAVSLTPSTAKSPVDWPLDNGTITCATCHAEPSCDEARDPSPPYHRGGPYTDPQGQCWQCHAEDAFQRRDPHHEGDKGCGTCHTATPPEGAPAAKALLRSENICEVCHKPERHAGGSTHFGKAPDDVPSRDLPLRSDGTIGCFTCHDAHKEGVAQHANPGALAIALRQRALTKEWLPVAASVPDASSNVEHPPLMALPAREGLCEACHDEGVTP